MRNFSADADDFAIRPSDECLALLEQITRVLGLGPDADYGQVIELAVKPLYETEKARQGKHWLAAGLLHTRPARPV